MNFKENRYEEGLGDLVRGDTNQGGDFPANVSDLHIKQLKFYVLTDDSADPTQPVFGNPTGKGIALSLIQGSTTVNGQAGFNNQGIVSTLTNGGGLASFIGKSPAGTWSVILNGLGDALANSKIVDVIMVISYDGTTPQWTIS